VTNYLRCPSGEQSWDGVEWTNQARFGVGCGRNSAEQAHAVYAIDLEGESCKQLVTGTEVLQPCLLSGDPVSFEIDSFGAYNDPPTDAFQASLGSKILIFWRIFDSLEIAIAGSSQAHFGINPVLFTGDFNYYNLAAVGCSLRGQKKLILNYLLNHGSRLKLICSSLDINTLQHPEGDVSWDRGVGQSKGYLYDSCNKFWRNNVTKDFKEIIRHIRIIVWWDTLNLGFLPVASFGWGADPPPYVCWDTTDPYSRQNLSANMDTITMMADILRNSGIHWIMINYPVSPKYQSTISYSNTGPSWQTADAIIQYLQGLDSSNMFFHFYDANMGGNHGYGFTDFMDENHLSAEGAVKLTARVDSIIHAVLP
jgi:hypothetical protein